MTQKRHSFFYKNSLSIVFISLIIVSLYGQIITGLKQHNKMLEEYKVSPIGIVEYLSTGHFASSLFENWESEFLQMGLYVVLTVFLRQKGSSESKKLDEKEEVDREPKIRPGVPWPVRKGGLWLKLYSNSLTMAFAFLFILSFIFHAYGSLKDYNQEQILKAEPVEAMSDFIFNSKLWFESFQNWQSEFLSVASIVILSIFLRQKGSPESKPVDALDSETGS